MDERAAEARAHRARLGVLLLKALRGASSGSELSSRPYYFPPAVNNSWLTF